MKKIKIISILSFLILNITQLHAEEMYVTDRVILGVHQSPEENSLLKDSLPTGTKVEILETEASFSKVKLESGIEGWIKTEFLIKEKPSILLLGEVTSKLQTATEELKKLKEKSTKRERDLQTREDQVANSKSTIKDLKKQLKQTQTALEAVSKAGNVTSTTTVSTENSAELEAANSQIEELQKQIEELQNAAIMENVEQDEPSKAQLNSEIKKLLMRIKVAQANLNGEEIPSPEELAAIQPQMPLWYWVLLSMILILGFIFGTLFIDYMHRKKHGGFRL
jgi:SH3 domain protein